MARPKWQIEVPLSYLTPEEKSEVEEKLSVPLDPETALEELEEIAEMIDISIAVQLHDMHLSGVRISFDLACQIIESKKETDHE